MRFATLNGALEEAEIMRIFIWNRNLQSSSKKVCACVNPRIIYSAVRLVALKGTLDEAEIMRIFTRSFNFVSFSKLAVLGNFDHCSGGMLGDSNPSVLQHQSISIVFQ